MNLFKLDLEAADFRKLTINQADFFEKWQADFEKIMKKILQSLKDAGAIWIVWIDSNSTWRCVIFGKWIDNKSNSYPICDEDFE